MEAKLQRQEGAALIPDWFDELPMHTVAMPDSMISPDLGQPASYSLLQCFLSHTQNQLLHHTQITNSRLKVWIRFQQAVSEKQNKQNVHIHSYQVIVIAESYHQHCILSTLLFSHFTINVQWRGKFARNESLDKTQSTKSTVELQADGVS